jgi:hypothetical protein
MKPNVGFGSKLPNRLLGISVRFAGKPPESNRSVYGQLLTLRIDPALFRSWADVRAQSSSHSGGKFYGVRPSDLLLR